ncbi:MAG: DinB family protein [Gemmataceae bacterium]|nr:DinB family protein [Gemmataceae bacterium]MDW8264661.1 DinB family protein [Gemmataceae bacterium]
MAPDMAALVRSAIIDELEKLHAAVRDLVEPLSPQQLWARPVEPGNSVGHLVLHLTGNLNHYVGAQLGHTGYVRDREREFTETNHPSKAALLAALDDAVATFRRVVGGLSAADLAAPHPEARFGTVLKALLHLLTHFALHRGQMSYLVRLPLADERTSAVPSPGDARHG